MLTLIWCPFHPHVTAAARKRPQSFCQKCRWQVTPKHMYTIDPKKFEWFDSAAVQSKFGNLSGNKLARHCRGTLGHSHLSLPSQRVKKKKEKAQAGNEWLNILPKFLQLIQVRKKPPPSRLCHYLFFFSPARMFSIIALKCALTSQSNVDY